MRVLMCITELGFRIAMFFFFLLAERAINQVSNLLKISFGLLMYIFFMLFGAAVMWQGAVNTNKSRVK
jgi:hypothetical protein